MVAWQAFGLVFVAGLVTAVATGLGALPFFLVGEVSRRLNVALWGVASGIMLTASALGLVPEGLAHGEVTTVVVGLLVGVALVALAHRLLDDHEFDPGEYETADVRQLALILGVLTVHSFPEGIAIGVSFAALNLDVGVVPPLAVAMTVAISVHNIPEGVAISIPLREMGVSPWRMVGWSIFSSLPQPLGAVLAFAFVRVAAPLLPVGFGFAAGAMVALVVVEFVPEALETGKPLARNGYDVFAGGTALGGAGMWLLLVAV
ncbi:ZIP family metal transporter [Halosegnis rubeus]|uniref:ZIP family metal transporter n=1 Tax=Halosegnis rubeus TaxID=2212850 RepID=A0A5N5UFT7_9EURY|nr:ZIP family metal transporter [Halosegnis rubeus]KAB7517583.1 ZIP family metal transporter [Halosegnis rubeus]